MDDSIALTTIWLLAAVFAVAMVVIVWYRRRANESGAASLETAASKEEELARLGLSAVRPRTEVQQEAPRDPDQAPPTPTPPIPPQRKMPKPDTYDEVGVTPARPMSPKRTTQTEPSLLAESTTRCSVAARSPLWERAVPDSVGDLVASLRAALDAQRAVLLRLNREDDRFYVDAIAGADGDRHTASFSAVGNALRHVLDDRAISLVETDALDALGYHRNPSRTVGHAAALSLGDQPDTPLLLVVDRSKDASVFDSRDLKLLGQYADLLSALVMPAQTAESASARREAASGEEASGETTNVALRPRSELIAEEMAEAREWERPLALALVVPRNADAIGAKGAEAVAEAEGLLFSRLRTVEGCARVERFGELMAGAFCHAGPTLVEAWAERVAVSGPPVHIGVAFLRARHTDPDTLRAEAAEALHDAYERGESCVILE